MTREYDPRLTGLKNLRHHSIEGKNRDRLRRLENTKNIYTSQSSVQAVCRLPSLESSLCDVTIRPFVVRWLIFSTAKHSVVPSIMKVKRN